MTNDRSVQRIKFGAIYDLGQNEGISFDKRIIKLGFPAIKLNGRKALKF